jgi:hypothetical protein
MATCCVCMIRVWIVTTIFFSRQSNRHRRTHNTAFSNSKIETIITTSNTKHQMKNNTTNSNVAGVQCSYISRRARARDSPAPIWRRSARAHAQPHVARANSSTTAYRSRADVSMLETRVNSIHPRCAQQQPKKKKTTTTARMCQHTLARSTNRSSARSAHLFHTIDIAPQAMQSI